MALAAQARTLLLAASYRLFVAVFRRA